MNLSNSLGNNYKSIPVDLNKDENAHRFALTGKPLEREREF